MPAEVIDHVHALARRNNTPNGITFANCAGQVLHEPNHDHDVGAEPENADVDILQPDEPAGNDDNIAGVFGGK
jgi:hypothetical protein